VSVYDDRPWLGLYGDQPTEMKPEFSNALAMFKAGLAADRCGTSTAC
jgi:long-chain acyl-CoA synthetase